MFAWSSPRCFLRLAAATVLLSACSTHRDLQQTASAPASHAQILSFYARDSAIAEAGYTVLCYGVSNATTVRIDPPVEAVWPALSRCVEVRPQRDTRYTMTATGSDGQTVSESVSIRFAADPATLPKISYFRVERRQTDYAGRSIISLSFAAQNAEEVSIDPPVFKPLRGSPSGQFYVRPDKTTTYTLSVTGKYGHVVRQELTVEVLP